MATWPHLSTLSTTIANTMRWRMRVLFAAKHTTKRNHWSQGPLVRRSTCPLELRPLSKPKRTASAAPHTGRGETICFGRRGPSCSPNCTTCGRHIPDAYHLTFECPATLPQRTNVLRAITNAAATDRLIGGLTRGAPEIDVLTASLGGTPMLHVPPDHPSYAALRTGFPTSSTSTRNGGYTTILSIYGRPVVYILFDYVCQELSQAKLANRSPLMVDHNLPQPQSWKFS